MPLPEVTKVLGISKADELETSDETTHSPTVDELLKMLSGKCGPTASNRPPPVPPKPKSSIETMNQQQQDVKERGGFRRYFSSSKTSYSPVNESNNSSDSSSVSFNFIRKYDAYDSAKQRDNNDRDYTATTTTNTNQTTHKISLNTSNSAKYSQKLQQQQPQQQQYYNRQQQQQIEAINERNYPNTTTSTQLREDDPENQAQQTIVTDYELGRGGNGKATHHHHHAIKPIVTESLEEANNNNITKSKPRAINKSTVEILEVPFKQQQQLVQQKLPHNTTYGNNNFNNPTFSRSSSASLQKLNQQQQLFYENNSYATPVVTTTATDDEDGGDQSDDDGGENNNDVTLPTEMEVESLLNDDSSSSSTTENNPPRTSTPNIGGNVQQCSMKNNNNNNNESRLRMQHVSIVNMQGGDYIDNDEDNMMNISRETDELTNTSALNQSGGGEIIGINDNSDLVNNSSTKNSPPRSIHSTQLDKPYTVQVFNESIMSSNVSPTGTNSQSNTNNQHENFLQSANHSPCKERMQELEKLTNSLMDYVDKLKNQVSTLTSKVDDLELQLDKQQKTVKQLSESSTSVTNISQTITKPLESFSTSTIPPNYGLSQSTSTINRLAPQSSATSQTYTSQNPMSTYSRSHVATISRNSNPPPTSGQSLNGLMSTSMNSNTNRLAYNSNSSSNTIAKTLKKSHAHASTNSLYADSHKSGSTSISPTPHYQHRQQSTSPTSITNLSNRHMAHTSMLSLSSLGGQQTGSTLKKASAVSDSVSNLSQIGSQLSTWPSISDFVPAKHRAKDVLYSEDERLIRMVLYNRLITMRLPNWAESNYDLEKVVEPPSIRLKLDWVYGYRGRDCRSNIFYLPTGECVYFVASIVVLYNPEEKTQRHYLGHTESVKCLTVHPNKLIIASGQSSVVNRRDKRPIVRVWNTVSLATLRVIGFNEDFDRSICCLAFSKHDQGATLAVVDESNEHTITLLDWQREKSWRLAEANSGHEPVLAIDFHPIDKYSLVAVGKSTINFWDTRGLTLTKKAGLFDKYDKPKYVLCLTFNDFGDTITGDSNGNVIIWPRGGNRPKRIIHDAHVGGVFSVLAMKDGSYLTGGRDRRIVEWDENFNRTGREAELPEHCGGVRFITYARGAQVLIGTLRNSILLGSFETNFVLIMQGHTEATSSLAIHPNNDQYLTGGYDNQIHLFDTKAHDVVWSKCLMMPATAASFSPNGHLLVIGSTLGKWLVLDAITQEILFTKCDGSGTINCIKFSPDGEYFSMGSSDFQIYIYQTTEAGNKFCRIGTCVGHTAPIKEIDWSDDSHYIQSQSLNFELLFWKAINCRPMDDMEIIDDLRWFTHNCTLGFSVIGIWSDSIDSALINYCDKSNNEDLMVSVTDTGNINIFKWPPCYNQCLSQKYYGNVDKFNFIKFLPDDSRLIAVGAKNCVTTEWIVDKGEPLDMS